MPNPSPIRGRNRRFSVVDGMAFVAGLAIAFWVFREPLLQAWNEPPPPGSMGFRPFFAWIDQFVYALVTVLLGGLSLAGIPLLLRDHQARPRRWGPGKTLWFAQGTAAWLLWPPVVYQKLSRPGTKESVSAICYFYGTPLMAVYMVAALWAGRSLRQKRRAERRVLCWRERFGLILGLAWACTGLYLLSMFYRMDVLRR